MGDIGYKRLIGMRSYPDQRMETKLDLERFMSSYLHIFNFASYIGSFLWVL